MADAPKRGGADGAPFVREVVRDPNNVPDVTMLYGYIGASSEAGHERVYLSPDLTNYVEVPESAILHRAVAAKEQDPHGGATLWIKKEAALIYKMAPAAQALAHYFAGAIQRGPAGLGAGGVAAPETALHCTANIMCMAPPPTQICVTQVCSQACPTQGQICVTQVCSQACASPLCTPVCPPPQPTHGHPACELASFRCPSWGCPPPPTRGEPICVTVHPGCRPPTIADPPCVVESALCTRVGCPPPTPLCWTNVQPCTPLCPGPPPLTRGEPICASPLQPFCTVRCPGPPPLTRGEPLCHTHQPVCSVPVIVCRPVSPAPVCGGDITPGGFGDPYAMARAAPQPMPQAMMGVYPTHQWQCTQVCSQYWGCGPGGSHNCPV